VNVLVVDDSSQVRSRFAAMLSAVDGVEAIKEAGSFEEALDLLRAYAPVAVVLDLHLPGGSGLALLPVIKRERPDALLIVVTNESSSPYRRVCLASGADAFFDKSRDFDAVIATIAASVTARRSAGPAA
jgi:DNA-binding NarL/FixJ family response regulator